MVSNLQAIEAKFSRAVEHHDTWNNTVDEWLDGKPYRVGGELQPDGSFAVSLHILRPIPPATALIFADFIHNLRATLDHVAWCLVPENKRGRGVAYPVCRKATDWGAACGSLPGVLGKPLSLIRETQPLQYNGLANEHPLSVLHDLDIATKHRLLLRQRVHVTEFEPEFHLNRPATAGEFVASLLPAEAIELMEEATELVRVRPVSEQDDLRVVGLGPVGMRIDFAPSLVGTNVPPLDLLPNLCVFVGSVIEWLRPVL